MSETSVSAQPSTRRPIWPALLRGLQQNCPACGVGRLYGRYLKVAETCPHCSEALHHQRADDAPPYITMMIVGHIVIGSLLSVEMAYHPETWVHMVVWGPVTLLLSLWLLPRVKGALIGLQWAARMHGFGRAPDPAEPDVWPPHGTV
jgi:uncharacterized protein (DUF983 family)